MQLDGGGVAAGRRDAAQRLGHRAHVMGRAAAADADVVDADLAGADGELGHLEARALEGLELDREEVAAVARLEGLEGGRRGRRPVGHRLGRDRDVDRRPDALEQRQHRLRPARAVEADERRAGVGEDLAGLDVVVAVVGLLALHARERDHRGQPERRADLEPDQGLADEVVGLRDHEVDALLDRPAELLLVLRAHDRARSPPRRPGRTTRCCRCCPPPARRPRRRSRSRSAPPGGSSPRGRRRGRRP